MSATSRRILSVVTLLIVAVSVGCTFAIAPPTPEPQPEVSANGVIFTRAQTLASLDAIGPEVADTWQPTATDIAQLEADLPAFLQTAQNDWLRPDPPIWERAPDYYRQYLGIVEGDTQLIYANFFCSEEPNWRTQFAFIMDGGDCYFQLEYDPQSREFTAFSVNGES